MRATLLLVLSCSALTGCQTLYATAGVAAGADVLTLTTIGRSVPDAVVSLIRDRDCSMVRLEQGLPYCVPPDAPPDAAAFCTASLGRPDCWAAPDRLPGQYVGLADAPQSSPLQIAHRAHHWPDSWSP